MHIIPADMPGSNVDAIVRKNACGLCGRKVAAFLNPRTKERYIACSSTQHDDAPIVKEWTPPKGEDTLNQEKQRRIDMVMEEHGVDAAHMLMERGVPLSGVLTKAQAKDVLLTVWPGADDLAIYKGVEICHAFGLHPLAKHLYLIPFNKKVSKRGEPHRYEEVYEPVLGIGASRLIAGRKGRFGYVDATPRLMTEEEQMQVWGKVEKDCICAITILETVDHLQARGYGRWKIGDKFQGADKGNTAQNMAFIRSERNAFTRLSPEPDVLNGVGVMDERYVETPSGTVDTTSGELEKKDDGEFHEVKGEDTETPPAPKVEAGPDAKDSNPAPAASADMEIPAVKKVKKPTPEECEDLKQMLRACGKTGEDLGNFCNGEPRLWGITAIEQLTRGQFDTVKAALGERLL